MKSPAPESASIAAGAISALGATTCCMLPLALVSLGLGGAWVAQLRSLERFYPVFVGLAIAAFCYAFYRLYLKRAPCATDAQTGCAVPVSRRGQRIAFWATLVAAKTLILFPIVYGVLEAKADLATKRAEAKYDPDKVSAESLARAVSDAGFPATLRQP